MRLSLFGLIIIIIVLIKAKGRGTVGEKGGWGGGGFFRNLISLHKPDAVFFPPRTSCVWDHCI